ncbi:MAG: AAA family ATPase [Desulfuromonadales bacterium]|nr:AAA family ATPase [Desulfuromonadales bacterium]MBN2791261.1 AAA family ATPase [Desulfuromonadales bacterium]
MAKKLFIAATGQNIGKTTASLSLMHLAQKKYRRVGFIKPLGPKVTTYKGQVVDKDAALMCQVFGLGRNLKFMSPVVLHPDSTRKALNGELDPRELEEKILNACTELEKKCDFLIIEGSGHPGVGSVVNLSNARIAKLLGAQVLLITGGGVGSVIDSVHLNKMLFEKEAVQIRAIMPNKLLPEKRESTLAYLRKAFHAESFAVFGGFNYQPVLANPTLTRVAKILDLDIQGNRKDAKRIIHHLQIGAPSTQRVTELLKPDTLLIVTSSRDELLVTLSNMYQIPNYREKIVGLLIPGVQNISDITQQILDRSRIPYLRTTCHTTGTLYRTISEDVYKLQADDKEKIDMIRELAEMRFDFDQLDELFNSSTFSL